MGEPDGQILPATPFAPARLSERKGAAALHHLRLGGRRQVDPDRPACSMIPASSPRTSSKRSTATRRNSAPRAASSISPCWSTASPPSASRASRSTSPTAISRPTPAPSSSPTPPATSNTPATWRPAPRPPISRSSWSTRARAYCRRPAGTPSSSPCSACATWWWRSTRWTSSTTARRDFNEIVAAYREMAQGLNFRSIAPCRFRRSQATTSPRSRKTPPGSRASRCCPISKRSRRPGRSWPRPPSAFRCNGSTGPISISAAFPAGSRAAWSQWATPSPPCPRAAPAASKASSPRTAICRAPSPGSR